ncbi:MAG: hypothetical protein AB7G47_02675 [Mycolicibacterium sp.]|uniref:Rv3852 family protein n=1 Tax=Mycolicibacterium sp. TaxID=2320850 RepID=UPI003D0F8408
MADQPDQPDEGADAAIPPHDPAAPPVNETSAPKKSAPAKKAPAKKTPAKKAAAKKAPAKKAPAKNPPDKDAQAAATTLPKSNGSLARTAKEAAKEAAAQAKSTVTTASNTVSSGPAAQRTDGDASRVPVIAALITGLFAIVVVLYVARRGGR